MLYRKIIVSGIGALFAGASGIALAQSAPVTMEQAIAVAVESNPQIAQAQYNTEAIQFERKQAQGQFLPTLDVEGFAGVRRLQNPTRDTLGISDDVLYPRGVEGRLDWKVFDAANCCARPRESTGPRSVCSNAPNSSPCRSPGSISTSCSSSASSPPAWTM
jgi:hypothetical protein